MRKLILLYLLLICCISTQAKIWRVNNKPGVTAHFTTAQAAHDAASDGDTIHLEPSLTGYGSLSTSKRLVWISTGTFLNENPGNQYVSTPGTLAAITVGVGSNGSVFSVVCIGNINIFSSQITFIRCKSNTLASGLNTDNLNIINCFVNAYIDINGMNSVVRNNIVRDFIAVWSTGSAVVANNVIVSDNGSVPIYNSVFQNNIISGTVNYSFYNSVVSYNMASNSTLPVGNNNQNGVNMANVFVNSSGTVDKDFLLKAGSPAIGAGFGGNDLGAFGGSSPFALAVQPAVPAITNLSAPASSGTNTIQVTFSAKSNN